MGKVPGGVGVGRRCFSPDEDPDKKEVWEGAILAVWSRGHLPGSKRGVVDAHLDTASHTCSVPVWMAASAWCLLPTVLRPQLLDCGGRREQHSVGLCWMAQNGDLAGRKLNIKKLWKKIKKTLKNTKQIQTYMEKIAK